MEQTTAMIVFIILLLTYSIVMFFVIKSSNKDYEKRQEILLKKAVDKIKIGKVSSVRIATLLKDCHNSKLENFLLDIEVN